MKKNIEYQTWVNYVYQKEKTIKKLYVMAN